MRVIGNASVAAAAQLSRCRPTLAPSPALHRPLAAAPAGGRDAAPVAT